MLASCGCPTCVQRVGEQEATNLPLDRTNDFTGMYAKAACAAAKETGVPCIDLWTHMQGAQVGTGVVCKHSSMQGTQVQRGNMLCKHSSIDTVLHCAAGGADTVLQCTAMVPSCTAGVADPVLQ
jgi:hypothetical protein